MFFSGSGRDSWSLGPLSDEAHSLIAEIGRRATLCTADPRETTFLYQRIFRGSSAFQSSVPCQHVHSFRVLIVTISDIQFLLLLILRPWE